MVLSARHLREGNSVAYLALGACLLLPWVTLWRSKPGSYGGAGVIPPPPRGAFQLHLVRTEAAAVRSGLSLRTLLGNVGGLCALTEAFRGGGNERFLGLFVFALSLGWLWEASRAHMQSCSFSDVCFSSALRPVANSLYNT